MKSTPEREKATEEKGNAADIKREVDCVEKDSILMDGSNQEGIRGIAHSLSLHLVACCGRS